MIIDCCRAGAIYSAACEELAEADLNKFMFLVSTDYKTDEFADQLSRCIVSTVNNDFIKQTVDKKDKRKKFLTLAPKGVEYVEEHHRNYEEWIKKLWSKLDNNEKEAFNITLTKMNQILKEEVVEKEEE